MLTWNQNGKCYEGTLSDGRKIDVDGDEFAEVKEHHIKTYREEGMDQEAAEQKAWKELSDPAVWDDDSYPGVTIYPIGYEAPSIFDELKDSYYA